LEQRPGWKDIIKEGMLDAAAGLVGGNAEGQARGRHIKWQPRGSQRLQSDIQREKGHARGGQRKKERLKTRGFMPKKSCVTNLLKFLKKVTKKPTKYQY
jgi:hypothetical protein